MFEGHQIKPLSLYEFLSLKTLLFPGPRDSSPLTLLSIQ
jgi:hypothetical protein